MGLVAVGISMPPIYHSYVKPGAALDVSVTKSPGHNIVSPMGVIIAGGAEDIVTTVVRTHPTVDV